MKKNGKKKGFTLIELIVVIAILGILAAILIPRFSGFQDKARSTQAITDAKQIATAIDSLQAEAPDGAWPTVESKVTDLAGVDVTSDGHGVLTLKENGGFEWEITINKIKYVAGRTATATAVGKVKMLTVNGVTQ